MSQQQDASSLTDQLTDDVGRPIPEIVLPVAAVGLVALLMWWWRISAKAKE